MIEEPNAFQARSKYLNVDKHWVHERIESGMIQIEWIRTESMVADIMTKAVSRRLFLLFREALVQDVEVNMILEDDTLFKKIARSALTTGLVDAVRPWNRESVFLTSEVLLPTR